VCVGNKPNYVYLNIISTGLYTTFIGGEILENVNGDNESP